MHTTASRDGEQYLGETDLAKLSLHGAPRGDAIAIAIRAVMRIARRGARPSGDYRASPTCKKAELRAYCPIPARGGGDFDAKLST